MLISQKPIKNSMNQKIIFLELNEINFDFIRRYINRGFLPTFSYLIDSFGIQETKSESIYEEIEPWIQWPTIRTGLDYGEHKIFRLGDICNLTADQHWELLEKNGYSVAAISPINAENRTRNSPFWIPDPWVDTRISGGGFCRRISAAIKQSVNDNAQEKISLISLMALVEAFLTRASFSSVPIYWKSLVGAFKKRHWSKAAIFDRLMADVYLNLWRRHEPDFSTLFLNSGAHIQHHYMCSSAVYEGSVQNPGWYLQVDCDPLLDILEVYDSILCDLLKIDNIRLMISTGMRQVPYERPTFYWRLRNHEKFLKKLGVQFIRVQPRMTRDFLIEFENSGLAESAEKVLNSINSLDGDKVFGIIENRGSSLFVTLTYANEIKDGFEILSPLKNIRMSNFDKEVVFVAIKNGHHDQLGYFIDTNCTQPKNTVQQFPIKDIHKKVLDHFGVSSRNELNFSLPPHAPNTSLPLGL